MITREEFESASDAGRRETSEHGALSVRYDEEADRVIIELPGDMLVVFPPDSVEGLSKATVDDLQSMEITPSGLGLHIERLDWDASIPGLMAERTGSKSWMASEMGKRGGAVRTIHKSEAARLNGRLGGRPRKRT